MIRAQHYCVVTGWVADCRHVPRCEHHSQYRLGIGLNIDRYRYTLVLAEWSVGWSVGLPVPVTVVNPTKTAEPIETPFWVLDSAGPKGSMFSMRCTWRHLAITTEPSMCAGDAACCQNTSTTGCVFWRLHTDTTCNKANWPFIASNKWHIHRRIRISAYSLI